MTVSSVAVRVMVVGSDKLLLGLTRRALRAPDYSLVFASGLDEALDGLFTHRPDFIVLAAEPDGTAGTASCRELQAVEELPLIFLVPSAETEGAVRALTCADDYVALPVAPEELEARVRAVLRRAGNTRLRPARVYDDGCLRLNLQSRTASLDGGTLHLTPTEYRLLALLATNARRLLTHDELLRRVWGPAYTRDSHLLRLQVANLRAKLERPGGHRFITTQRGLGYTFQPAPPSPLASRP